jgi:hypothetical protein
MYVDAMQRGATELAGKATSAEPAVGLAAVASLRLLLETLEQLQVEHARDQGWSWQRIADALRVSKQAVHKKYGDGRRLSRRP